MELHMNSVSALVLPDGVRILTRRMHHDARGSVTEVYRQTWVAEYGFKQWNCVHSVANVLRGVHVHIERHDYLVLLSGHALFGVRDLRPGSPTENMSAMFEMSGDDIGCIIIPAGVAHGFYFDVPSVLIYGLSEYWTGLGEVGCRYDDPDLELSWPTTNPILSETDKAQPRLREIRHLIRPWQPIPGNPFPQAATHADTIQ